MNCSASGLHVVRAIAAIAAIDASLFALVFGGGTALARAHKLVRWISEDVDFKIVLKARPPSVGTSCGNGSACCALRSRTHCIGRRLCLRSRQHRTHP